MSEHDECLEPYHECMRQRQERVRRTIAANPQATTRAVAKLAGVSPMTVARNKPLKNNGVSGVTTFRSVKLSELYNPDILYSDHKPVRTIELALERCTQPELAYVLDKIFPFFNEVLKRRTHNGRSKAKDGMVAAAGAAGKDQAADDRQRYRHGGV